MTHVKRFKGIPMSKSMRGLCKEEDYEFLGMSEKATKDVAEGAGVLEADWRDKKEERVRYEEPAFKHKVRRQLEWEKQEQERLREIAERKKEKELQWRTHVVQLTSTQEKTLQDRLAGLRRFREFQRKVLVEEFGKEGGASGLTANQLLTRM